MPSERNGKVMYRRRAILFAGFAVLWIALAGRLFFLQILKYEDYKSAVADNIERETVIAATRGTIYDRNNVPLASNITTYRVFIAPNRIENDEQKKLISENLSAILDVPYDDIYQRTQKEKRADETVKKNVDADTADLVRDFISNNELSGMVHLEASSKRYYPYSTLASAAIGVAGTDQGLAGIELSYDKYLKGTDGKYITAKSGNGGSLPFKYDTYIDATNGYNVVTTLDTTIQAVLDEQLEAAFQNSSPLNRIAGIVMNPNNGEIYGMSTYPPFDLNNPYNLDDDSKKVLEESGLEEGTEEYTEKFYELVYAMWKNKCVSELYEPGSTFKVVTTSMALEENVTNFDEEFSCSGSYRVEGWNKPISCHKKSGHGTHPYWYMLQQSCNPTLMQVAQRIGLDKFYSYFEAFGYTTKTGIDLPGESYGVYHSFSAFNEVELAVYSFGQTFKTTPLQQISAISSVANGGYLVTPHIVSKLVDDNGNVVADFSDSVKYQVVSSEVCDKISTVLEDGVAHDGGAKNTRVSGYKIAAKTGTSEVRDKVDEEGNTKYVVCSTVAYAPSDDPQVAVIIIVDEPTVGSLFGSYIAAPFVANVLEEILPYLGVDRDEVASSVTVTNCVNMETTKARAAIDILGVDAVVVGDGGTVTAQVPSSGSQIEKESGVVILYTGDEIPENTITVPDLTGKSAAQANSALTSLGLNINISGAEGNGSVVYSQSIPEGTQVTRGTLVTVELMFTTGANDG